MSRQIIFAIGSANTHPLDAMHIAVDCADRGAKTDFDPPLFSHAAPLLQLTDTTPRHVNGNASLKIPPGSDPCVFFEKFPANSEIFHPMDGGIRLFHQSPRQ